MQLCPVRTFDIMKAYTPKLCVFLILCCRSVLGADTGIKVITWTSSTNSLAWKRDVFTRDGRTNLVCLTTMKADGGVVLNRIQDFYHDGLLVGVSISSPPQDIQIFETKADSPYSVLISHRSPDKSQDGSVSIEAKDRSVVDMFTCTNGVYFPVEGQQIQKENDLLMKARAEVMKLRAEDQVRDAVK